MIYFSYPFQENWHFIIDEEKYVEYSSVYTSSLHLLVSMVNTFEYNTDRDLSVIATNSSGPVYFNQSNHIILNLENKDNIEQMVFQLSHEMCHYFLDRGLKNGNLKWFEEVICTICSHYFLNILGPSWEKSSIDFLKFAGKSMPVYSFRNLLEKDEVPLTSSLTYERYDRQKNNYVVSKLIPIFFSNPTLWRDVPKLSEINSDTIADLLNKWENISLPNNKPAIAKIRSCFDYD